MLSEHVPISEDVIVAEFYMLGKLYRVSSTDSKVEAGSEYECKSRQLWSHYQTINDPKYVIEQALHPKSPPEIMYKRHISKQCTSQKSINFTSWPPNMEVTDHAF